MSFNEICRILKFLFSVDLLRMGVLWTLSLAISYLRLFFTGGVWGWKYAVYSRQKVTPISDSQRPVCIVTGATSGIGAAAALALSKEGFFVILVGRSGYFLSKTMAEIRKLNENAQLEAFELLINNAGILATSYRATTQGFDEMMTTNYMGPFSLTQLLLPLLLRSPVPSRIVNVSSFTHRTVNDIQVDEEFVCRNSFSSDKNYPFAQIYEYSKLCILLFSYKLHQHIISLDKVSQLSVNVADPGAVNTKIMRELPSCLSQSALSVLKLLRLLQSPEEGVSAVLDASFAPPGTSGMYFFGGNGRTMNSSPLSYDAKVVESLWETSNHVFSELKRSHDKISPH